MRPCSRNIGSWEEKASSGSTQGECEIVPLAAVETGKPLPLPSCQSVVLVQRSAAAQTPPACQSASLSAPFCALLIPSLAACRSAAFQASFPAPKGGGFAAAISGAIWHRASASWSLSSSRAPAGWTARRRRQASSQGEQPLQQCRTRTIVTARNVLGRRAGPVHA